jgi:hypothetical protein
VRFEHSVSLICASDYANSESMEYASKVVIALNHQNQDVLVAQARSFIETTLVTYGSSLLLCHRCRLGHILSDSL